MDWKEQKEIIKHVYLTLGAPPLDSIITAIDSAYLAGVEQGKELVLKNVEKIEKQIRFIGMLHTGQNQYNEGGKLYLEYQKDIDIAEKELQDILSQLQDLSDK